MPKPSRQILPHSGAVQQVILQKNDTAEIVLPIVMGDGAYGMATSRWNLTWKERLRVLFSGSVWVQQITFKKPLQPLKVLVYEPTRAECYLKGEQQDGSY